MGKQVNFFMSFDDEIVFFAEVERAGGHVFPSHYLTRVFPLLKVLPKVDRTFAGSQLVIAQNFGADELVLEFIATRNEFFVDMHNSHAIGFSRSVARSGCIHRGRVWAQMPYWVKTPGAGIALGDHKGKYFKDFYNYLARWIRRNYTRYPEFGFYCGPGAWGLYKQGWKLRQD